MYVIKSKVKTIGFWKTPILILIISSIFTLTFLNDPIEKDRIMISIWAVVMLSLLISQLWSSSKILTINTVDKTISITHFFTRKKVVYNFTDIDGYVEIIEKAARGNNRRVLYLVKGERFIQKISSYLYSNMNEIEQGLQATTYLGKREYSFLNHYRILLGRKVFN